MKGTVICLALLVGLSAIVAGNEPDLVAETPIISHITREATDSHSITAIGYSKHLQALEIQFHTGQIYRYLNVPVGVDQGLLHAESKGRYFAENIRGKYRYLRVRPRQQ